MSPFFWNIFLWGTLCCEMAELSHCRLQEAKKRVKIGFKKAEQSWIEEEEECERMSVCLNVCVYDGSVWVE
ncbi:hypothetical protein BDP81DRAFT_422755 [Colletotrichum phormii]|uniref:Uncharacterized protein n=1 Tax=Colletotrichum phormii TaxID=359342 RepID=A0AAJ0EG16_9PEZI|nr:uncharacterized protein BDP81DRAFT_422755 [Colletotrichum phormii]KAK1638827.1 hypothetical protein BDP81DRAFT_422755 [Colletotrichum phormii]